MRKRNVNANLEEMELKQDESSKGEECDTEIHDDTKHIEGKSSVAQRFLAKAVKARRMQYPQAQSDSGKLPLWTKLVYAAPALAITSLTMLISIHGTIFFTKIGAKVAFLAFFTAVARSFDVVTDPLMGYMSDNCKLPMGRRRPFMLGGCWFYAGFFMLLFSPPIFLSPLGVVVWFGIFYVLFYLADTTSNVPFNALGPELTESASERDSLFFYYGLSKAIGVLTAAVAPVMLIFYFKSHPEASYLVKYSCNCEFIAPSGPLFSASRGIRWDAARWGNYSDNVYDFPSLCKTSFCNPTCQPSDTDCDHTLRNGQECAPGLNDWCSDRYWCESKCDVGATRAGFHFVAILFGGYYVIAIIICVFLVSERKGVAGPKAPPMIPALLRTLRNRPFMTLVLPWAMDYTAYTMIGTMLPFYVIYVVQPQNATPWCDNGRRCPGLSPCKSDADCCSPDKESSDWCSADFWLGIGLVGLMSATIVSTPFWLSLVKMIGKNKAWLLFNALAAVTNGLFVFVGQDPKLCILMAVLNGLPNGAMFMNESILADVIDYDEFLTGQRSEGRFTIFQTFIPKVVSIPAQAVPLGLLAAFGFVQPIDGIPQEQPDSVKSFIKVVFFVLPCCLALLSFALKLRYPIKNQEQMNQITEGIALHMKGLPAFDPISKKMATPFTFEDESEEAWTWKMDCFFLQQLKTLAANGPVKLKRQVMWTFIQSIIMALAIFLVIASSTAAGALDNATVAWIPALCAIMLGMSLCYCGIQMYRLKVIDELKTNPIPQQLLDRWIVYISGVDYIRNRDEMVRIEKILQRLSSTFNIPEDNIRKAVTDLLPDTSGTAGMSEFATKKDLLNRVYDLGNSDTSLLDILSTINEKNIDRLEAAEMEQEPAFKSPWTLVRSHFLPTGFNQLGGSEPMELPMADLRSHVPNARNDAAPDLADGLFPEWPHSRSEPGSPVHISGKPLLVSTSAVLPENQFMPNVGMDLFETNVQSNEDTTEFV